MGQAGRAAEGEREEEGDSDEERRQVMAVYKQPKSKNWWYKFNWNGEAIRESTKQTNKRVAEQMEAAHRTSLAKGEVGIREKKPVATLSEFLKKDFIPYVESKHAAKPGTLEYYRDGAKMVLKCEWASEKLDQISNQHAQLFAAKFAKLSASRINCGL